MKKLLNIVLALSIIMVMSCKEEGSHSPPPPQNTPNAPSGTAWKYTTSAGINVATEKSTITQYNTHWEVGIANEQTWKWEDIDWLTLDEAFVAFREFYCNLGWNVCSSEPYELNIYVKPWDSRCVDAETPSQPYEIYEYINSGWNCIDGWFQPSSATIYLHLGDDPGTDHETTYEGVTTFYYAFEETALPDELKHFFQWKAGRPLENNNDPTPAIPRPKESLRIGYQIILPGEEEEEEEDNPK